MWHGGTVGCVSGQVGRQVKSFDWAEQFNVPGWCQVRGASDQSSGRAEKSSFTRGHYRAKKNLVPLTISMMAPNWEKGITIGRRVSFIAHGFMMVKKGNVSLQGAIAPMEFWRPSPLVT